MEDEWKEASVEAAEEATSKSNAVTAPLERWRWYR